MSEELRQGQRIAQVPKGQLLGPKKARKVIQAANAFLNLRVTRGDSDGFWISGDNAVLQLKRGTATTDTTPDPETPGSVVDSQFDPYPGGTACDVLHLVISSDKIYAGGGYGYYNDIWRPGCVTVLKHSMELDTPFHAFSTEDGIIGRIAGGAYTEGLAMLASGNIATGGTFNYIQDYAPASTYALSNLCALKPNGEVLVWDGFSSAGPNGRIKCLCTAGSAATPTILVVGSFTSWAGSTQNRIVLISKDGVPISFSSGSGPNTTPNVCITGSSCYYIGGSFTDYDGTSIAGVARIGTGGVLDATFDPGTGSNGTIQSLALDGDGNLFCGGAFTTFDSLTRGSIVKLASDGSVDTGFDPSTGFTGGAAKVYAIALQGTKLICGGDFTAYRGTARAGLCRINSDGTLDTTWTADTAGRDARVYALALLSGGDVIVGGSFTSIGTSGSRKTRGSIARLSPEGVVRGP